MKNWFTNILVQQHFKGPNPLYLDKYPEKKRNENVSCLIKGKKHVLEHLQLEYDEADLRIPLHVLDALKTGHKMCVVVLMTHM